MVILGMLPFMFPDTIPETDIRTAVSAQENGYISQTYIDTMVQHAFYQFHLAETAIHPQKSRRQAIDYAKGVVRKLRRMAKGDANENYILFKASELEQHAYLEEKDLLLSAMKEGQKTLNQLIAQYNAELAKSRPDFKLLVALHKQVDKIDVRKANQIASSINQRNRNIAREVMSGIEKKMLKGDFSAAREYLDYCRAQQGYLNVSQSRCNQWEQQLSQIEKADLHRADITEQLDRAESLIEQKKLSQVWGIIPPLQQSINSSSFSDRQAIDYRSRLTRLIQRIDHLEDSLFTRNVAILRQQGIDPAIEFMQTVLVDYGVSRSCVMKVDSAIMAVSPQGRQSSGAVREELSDLVGGGGSNSSLTMESAKDIARKRAEAKMDSIRAIEEQKARLAAIEQARLDSIRLVELQKQERKLRKHRDKARKKMARIVELLDKNRIKKAYKRFKKHQEPLRQYIDESTYAILEQSVLESFKNRHEKKKKKQRDIIVVKETPRQKREEKETIASQQPSETPDNQAHRNSVNQSSPVAHNQASENRQAYDSQRGQGQEQAQQIIIDIYTLLEKNQIRQAYDRFDANRDLMRAEIGGEPYEMVEQTVMQSYQSLREYLGNTSDPLDSPQNSSDPHSQYPTETGSVTEQAQDVEYENRAYQQSTTHESNVDRPTRLTEQAESRRPAASSEPSPQYQDSQPVDTDFPVSPTQYDRYEQERAAEYPNENQHDQDDIAAADEDYFSVESAVKSQLEMHQSQEHIEQSRRSELEQNQAKALKYISHLYKLLEQNQVEKAFVRFEKIREPLKKFSDPVAYQTLESILLQSYQNSNAN